MTSRTKASLFDHRGRPASDLRRPAEAAVFLGKAPGTLAVWRSQGRGPEHLKIGNEIFYLEADLREYREACRRRSTADARFVTPRSNVALEPTVAAFADHRGGIVGDTMKVR